MAFALNPHLEQIQYVSHGSSSDLEILDFSASIIKQPLPLAELLQKIEVYRYPDSESTEFRKTAARLCGLAPENILAGNGSSEIFLYLALSYINSTSKVGALRPAYGEYRRVTQIAGGQYQEFELSEEECFNPEAELLSDFITQNRLSVFFLTNPNNPTGRLLEQNKLLELVSKHTDVLFILDLAYYDYTFEQLDYQTLTRNNLFLVHSLTKNCGLAGLRCGFVTSTAENIRQLNTIKLPWNLNALAQAAGCWVVENRELCLKKVLVLKEETSKLATFIRQSGFFVLDSVTDYFLVKCSHSQQIKAELAKHKILVRDTTSQGLPGWLRITVKEPPENQVFKEKWLLVISSLNSSDDLIE